MKTKIKGFTLVECIVAIAVLSIGTLVMASIYACVAQINEKTFRANESLSQTIQRVETQSDKTTVTTNEVAIVKTGSGIEVTYTKLDSSGAATSTEYKMNSTVYVSFSQDSKSHSNKYYSDPNDDPIELRYKYFSSP